MSEATLTKDMETKAPTQDAEPSFAGALRGAWLFTWRSQLTWKQLTITGLCLLALPLLIYCTIPSSRSWAEAHPLFPQSRGGFRAPDGRARVPGMFFLRGLDLDPDQETDLAKITIEERERANREWLEKADADISTERQNDLINACRERINARAAKVLDTEQYSMYMELQSRRFDRRVDRGGTAPWGRTVPFFHWLMDFYFFVVLPLQCVRLCGGCIRDELQADTLRFLLTRPASRARLMLAKYLSQVAWLQLLGLVEVFLLFAAGILCHVPRLWALLPLLLAAQLLAVPAWAALGLFLGLASNRAIAVAIIYGLIVELGIGRIPTNLNALSLMRHLKVLLAHNASLQELFHWSTKGTWFSVAVLIAAPLVFLSLGGLLFTYREYLHPAEIQQ